ncbi:MAG: T9SS type A sorting domain-containing protein [Bacteroidota bacterium]|nr:T9SS type A sorting domain-containing protein [Bacteroidota bacterium]
MNNKKFFILLLFFTCYIRVSYAQISEGGTPYSFSHGDELSKIISYYEMPKVDVKRLLTEDLQESSIRNKTLRFGYDMDVNLNPVNSGRWEVLKNGDRIWRLGIKSEGAKSINLIFNKYIMPNSGKLFIYSTESKDLIGAFTYKNNNKDSVFATTILRGQSIILEYYEPKEVYKKIKLNISKVIHGYKDLFSLYKDYGGSESCEININCPEGSNWQKEKRAVAMILKSNNSRICTGCLLNNVRQDSIPYFLTANHCLTNESTNTWIFMFNYESNGCSNNNGPTFQTINGADMIATDTPSDFALLKLSSKPPASYNVYYSGWSALNQKSDSVVVIHHPYGDIKKISMSFDTIFPSDWSSGVINTHWGIDHYNLGSTEKGSSGAPLFSKFHKIIGQLQGGDASCSDKTDGDYYGSFYYSWDKGTTKDTRLKDWLDPDNTGTFELNGADFSPITKIMKIEAPVGQLCDTSFVPVVIFRNISQSTVSTLIIKYQIDNDSIHIYNWSGSLLKSQDFSLYLDSIKAKTGKHIFKVQLLNTNGSSDTLSTSFSCLRGEQITLKLKTDMFGEENYYKIFDSNWKILYRDSNLISSYTYLNNYCLAKGCYHFVIYDSNGNGICCGLTGQGNYVIKDWNNVLDSGGQFKFSDTANFCLEKVGISIPEINKSSIAIFPNPNKGNFVIELNDEVNTMSLDIYSILGQKVYSDKIEMKKNYINTNFAPGLYILKIYNNKLSFTTKILITKSE